MSPKVAPPSEPFHDCFDYRRRYPDGRIGSDPSLSTPEHGERIYKPRSRTWSRPIRLSWPDLPRSRDARRELARDNSLSPRRHRRKARATAWRTGINRYLSFEPRMSGAERT